MVELPAATDPATAESTGPRLVLASGSPRRRELLAALGANFLIVASDAEDRDIPAPPAVAAALGSTELPPANHPTLLAWRKASDVAARGGDTVVLAADTVVALDGEALNKPGGPAEAEAMLGRLSGRRHLVYTGLCVVGPPREGALRLSVGGRERSVWLELVMSEVWFRELGGEEIRAYVASGEPLDKAGAYGLQGFGGTMVRAVHGSYTAVVGLPLPTAHSMLRAAGVTGLRNPDATYRSWVASQGKEPLPCPPTLP